MTRVSQYSGHDSVRKSEWRVSNALYLREFGRLVWREDGFLRGKYLELVTGSQSGSITGSWNCDLLLERSVIRSVDQFKGVTFGRDEMLSHLDSRSTISVSMNDGLAVAQKMAGRGDPPCVINFDGENEAGNGVWWRKHGYVLKDLAVRSSRVYGEFILILNAVLDSRKGGSLEERERRHMEMLERELYPLRAFDVQPEVYRASAGQMRMLTIRAVLREA